MEEITSRTYSNMWLKKTLNQKNFENNEWKRKISESFWIKDLRPTLNAQDISVPLKLYINCSKEILIQTYQKILEWCL